MTASFDKDVTFIELEARPDAEVVQELQKLLLQERLGLMYLSQIAQVFV